MCEKSLSGILYLGTFINVFGILVMVPGEAPRIPGPGDEGICREGSMPGFMEVGWGIRITRPL